MTSFPSSVASRGHRYHTRSTTTDEELPAVQLNPRVVQIRNATLERAKRHLIEQPNNGSVTIAERITLQEYAKYVSTHPKLGFHICLIDGDIKAYKIPSPARCETAQALSYFIPNTTSPQPQAHHLIISGERIIPVGLIEQHGTAQRRRGIG